ncbi:MAG: hypothetical protein LC808_30170 [Actinobacteria bacterium]|nr:hypothetical protein [Actinomycetota bacterium]
MDRPGRTINQIFDEFLLLQSERLSDSSVKRYDEVLSYFRSCMDGYGHQWLSDEEAELFDREYGLDEEVGSFCNLFGPEKILENLDDFVGWFLVRKAMPSKSTLQATPAVLRKLVRWLVEEGHVPWDPADGSAELLEEAGSLAKAEEFSSRLYDLMEAGPMDSPTENQDWENEMAVISRVEREMIWLQNEETGYELSLRVPRDVAKLAEPGWRISALNLGRTPKGWCLLEMGNVYPI